MSENTSTIIYTITDEAPALATYSFLPIVEAFAGGRCRRRDPRHLARRAHHRDLPGAADRRAADRRRAGRTGRTRADARREHHQAAEHQGLDPAAQGRDRRAQAQGYDLPSYPDEPSTPERGRGAHPLRHGARQCREPGAARGQLRPSRAEGGQGVREDAPAFDGRLAPDSKSHVATWGTATSTPASSRSP